MLSTLSAKRCKWLLWLAPSILAWVLISLAAFEWEGGLRFAGAGVGMYVFLSCGTMAQRAFREYKVAQACVVGAKKRKQHVDASS